MRAIQLIETARSEAEAREMLRGILHLEDALGGRVLPPTFVTPTWRVQGFLRDDTDGRCWLPDGCTRVYIPEGQKRAMGIAA